MSSQTKGSKGGENMSSQTKGIMEVLNMKIEKHQWEPLYTIGCANEKGHRTMAQRCVVCGWIRYYYTKEEKARIRLSMCIDSVEKIEWGNG